MLAGSTSAMAAIYSGNQASFTVSIAACEVSRAERQGQHTHLSDPSTGDITGEILHYGSM